MKIRLSLVLFVLFLFAAVWGVSVISGFAATSAQRNEEIAKAVIAREKAGIEAWQRKDKAFYADYLADDATYFAAMNPYLEINPKETLIPKFDQYAEMFKVIDFQMYNPRVQVYGDTAILTYNSSSMVNFGGRTVNYTSKMTTVYVKQGNTWRSVHAHESMNGAPQ
ncbi:MAG TPA: nuclear transport factor 2 family protein [Pyrinomonadaceae bacterium]|nr:nuclear transport factor 2 family protein [Pyrinomonadaceae bacterium]